jgi:hypothetical protein
MIKVVQTLSAAVLLIAFTYSAGAQSITSDLAKTCREQTIKAHPTPVAGSKSNGVNEAQRAFFKACVERGAENKQKN